MAVLFALLTISVGALHHHVATSAAARGDCKACSWTHSAAAGLRVAAPALAALTASVASSPRLPDPFVSFEFTPHSGRAPPSIA
ncbi:MAG: hypothetical protein A2Y95_04605 [Deltaproteobacteria bacterium RBG_13_65_10]|jgi:hypothetical protein|nr:MAG: hypothetical protein A2Y95_04605 [Deltaproteobacteria bacterium RBG_13_65_10]